MAFLIGTDEAGYGPNLGPLVVSASLWHVPGASDCVDLYQCLSDTVCAGLADSVHKGHLALADSKVLYTAGCGLGRLELGVLAAMSVIDTCPRTWRELWTLLHPDGVPDRDRLPWHRNYDASLPVATECQQLKQAADRLREGLRRAGVSLCWLQATVVQPQRLNQLMDQLGSKGAALSLVTLQLVNRLLCRASDAPVWVVCDKHGGRNRYGPLLQQHFPDYLIEVHHESRQQSVYRTGPRQRRVEFRFCVRGEQFCRRLLRRWWPNTFVNCRWPPSTSFGGVIGPNCGPLRVIPPTRGGSRRTSRTCSNSWPSTTNCCGG